LARAATTVIAMQQIFSVLTMYQRRSQQIEWHKYVPVKPTKIWEGKDQRLWWNLSSSHFEQCDVKSGTEFKCQKRRRCLYLAVLLRIISLASVILQCVCVCIYMVVFELHVSSSVNIRFAF
jgi:hypothetical protein